MAEAIVFRCPNCNPRGRMLGQSAEWRTERGNVGVCGGCGFIWSRRHDWRVFVRASDGRTFESARDFDIACGLLRSSIGRPWTLSETLHELLEEIMIRPPTLAVVELWTSEQKRTALEWAAREVLALEGEDITHTERPRFVEEGAATA